MYSARYERTRMRDQIPTQFPINIALQFELRSKYFVKCFKHRVESKHSHGKM